MMTNATRHELLGEQEVATSLKKTIKKRQIKCMRFISRRSVIVKSGLCEEEPGGEAENDTGRCIWTTNTAGQQKYQQHKLHENIG